MSKLTNALIGQVGSDVTQYMQDAAELFRKGRSENFV